MGFVGALYDATGDYDISFIVGGVILVLAGLVFCLLHLSYFTRRSAGVSNDLLMSDPRDIPAPPSFSDLESEAFQSSPSAVPSPDDQPQPTDDVDNPGVTFSSKPVMIG